MNIWHYRQVASSLDVALKLVQNHKLEIWDSIIAESQTAGRGQLRRHWISPIGNIYATIRLPLEAPFDSTAASVATGVLLAKAMHEIGWPVLLKWPNDLVILKINQPAKLAGILLEERNKILLAGIGINVSSAPSLVKLRHDTAMPATCLHTEQIISADIRIEMLWQDIVKRMISIYNSCSSFAKMWKTEAERLLLWHFRCVELTDGQKSVCGTLTGLSPTGGVLIATGGQAEEYFGGSLKLKEN